MTLPDHDGLTDSSLFGTLHSYELILNRRAMAHVPHRIGFLPLGGKAMIKSELVQRLALANPHLYQRDVENIVNTIIEEITAALARGDRVELRGFGAFSIKNRPSRTGRNPRTGVAVHVSEKYVPFFKAGKEMPDRLNS